MKIILKYILTNIKERKLRTAVMFLSILLSSMLLFVSFSIGASYESAQQKMARGMAGSAVLSVKAANGAIKTDELPPLSSIEAGVGVLKGTALYHENGCYETIDLIAADLTELDKINPPHLANGEKITDFTGSLVILPDRFRPQILQTMTQSSSAIRGERQPFCLFPPWPDSWIRRTDTAKS